MNAGRIVMGVSTALALVGAVGFAFQLHTSEPIQGSSVGVCGWPQVRPLTSPYSMAASFVIKNTSGSPVTLRGLHATKLVGLRSAGVTVSVGADADESENYRVEAAVGVPADEVAKSTPVSLDAPLTLTLAPHSFARVITKMTLADGARAGYATDFALATDRPLGGIETQTLTASVGLGVDGDACSALGQ
ncbi:hypothetical protein AS850_13060 [Frondihabitans sp. 762G35]|uniref:hypothetical protein n=1 Tax=Frondihabitans sp. 762G35 TaxID=1446794 RepID=UPI000D216106|nr:hypothetical protein [Frondihabitans sp. 762G35]ARC58008.1 hypothetical protein AS850_13060 [Frondihabitans sp. 762G35]